VRPAAAYENSIRQMARFAPLVPLVAGALLLIVAEFVTVREVVIVTVVPPDGRDTGGDLHLYALGVLGLAILVMSYGAVVRGARPAAVALVVLSLAACFIVLAVDLPGMDDAGMYVRTYEGAQAQPAAGFYLESLGAGLALVGAVATLVLTPQRTPRLRSRHPT
jgi:hypothetical protein